MQYMGSKNRLSKEIVPIIQGYITEETAGYLEPFVGGGNIIDKISHHNKVGWDINEYLIELLKYVAEQGELPISVSEQEYNTVKSDFSKYPKWYIGLVGFTATFANKFFGGCARNKTKTTLDYSRTAIDNIRKQQRNLKGIKFNAGSFLDIDRSIKNFVIYCDPPYRGTTKYKTDPFPYEDYYNFVRELSVHNTVICSEYNMPSDFECIWEKSTTTQISKNREALSDKNIRIERLFIHR